MKKILLTVAAATITSPVLAGPYVNVETNASYSGSDYQSRATDLHIGYENKLGSLDWYVQGGPAVVTVDGADESDNRISGKVGANVAATEKLDFYGELSVLTADADTNDDKTWGTKLGAKFKF